MDKFQTVIVYYVIPPSILELDKGKRRSAPVLQVNEDNLPVFVEEILDVFAADVWRKVADVDTTLVASARHSG